MIFSVYLRFTPRTAYTDLMIKVAVILSGCGVMDGAEIHESVLTLLALDKSGAEIVCTAPDIPQLHVVNHAQGEPQENTSRNVLEEAARIARGNIIPLSQLKVEDVDAAIFPGGFGAAKNLCSFATEGTDMTLQSDVAEFLTAMHAAGKPLGFICIAPAIAAKAFGDKNLSFTIGNDPETAKSLESFGGQHVDKAVDDIVVDEKLKIVSTPAYMLAQRISEAETGINRLVKAVLELAS